MWLFKATIFIKEKGAISCTFFFYKMFQNPFDVNKPTASKNVSNPF